MGNAIGNYVVSLGKGIRIPFWVIFATVIIATTAVCGAVITNARGQLSSAAKQYQIITTQISSVRNENQRLASEIQRLTRDSNAIETAARERLGMVRPTDVVVRFERSSNSPNFGTVSFVR